MKLSLLHKNVNISSHKKRYFGGTYHNVSVQVMTKSLRYVQQIIISQAGTIKHGSS